MATKKSMYEAPTPAADRKKALQTALSQLEKTYGKGTVMRLGDRPDMNVEAVPTGSLALDAALEDACEEIRLSLSSEAEPTVCVLYSERPRMSVEYRVLEPV